MVGCIFASRDPARPLLVFLKTPPPHIFIHYFKRCHTEGATAEDVLPSEEDA